jgi:hypothetical protein
LLPLCAGSVLFQLKNEHKILRADVGKADAKVHAVSTDSKRNALRTNAEASAQHESQHLVR